MLQVFIYLGLHVMFTYYSQCGLKIKILRGEIWALCQNKREKSCEKRKYQDKYLITSKNNFRFGEY